MTTTLAGPKSMNRYRSLNIQTKDNGWSLSIYDETGSYELVFISRSKLNRAIQAFLNEEKPDLPSTEEGE